MRSHKVNRAPPKSFFEINHNNMKVFSINIPDIIKQIETSVDIQQLLCSNVWGVINDEGSKQVLVFKTNEELLISSDGDVLKGAWYVAANNYVIIESQEGVKLFQPIYFDGFLLALQRDGRPENLFMAIDSSANTISNWSIEGLESYLNSKAEEKRRIQEDEHRKKEAIGLIIQGVMEEAIRQQTDLKTESSAGCIIRIIGVIIATLYSIFIIVILVDDFEWWLLLSLVLAPFIVRIFSGLGECILVYNSQRDNALKRIGKKSRSDYQRANTLKHYPIIIRVTGWLLGILGIVITIWTLPIDNWWAVIGAYLGSGASFLLWRWLGQLIARRLEKRLFGGWSFKLNLLSFL